MADSRHPGACLCGDTRFEILGSAMIVHACHCTRCQRRFGGAFGVNLWIEESRVRILAGTPKKHGEVASEKGLTSESWACEKCGFGLWTVFHAAPKGSLFVRAGGLDDPAQFPPDVHIFTRSKQPWVTIPDDVPAFDTYYDFRDTWSAASQLRYKQLKEAS